MNSTELKQKVALEALKFVQPNTVLGIGTGSTVDCFIEALGQAKLPIKAAVSSSTRTEQKLQSLGIQVVDLNQVDSLSLYIDGADEINPRFELIKGGGGALTREKIVAEVADQFICIADESKLVQVLGQFPLPIEVMPMACGLISKKIIEIGGAPKRRENFTTDNGNVILDVEGLKITDPIALECKINQWPGVVTNGLFAKRPANVCLIASTALGVTRLEKQIEVNQ